MLKISMERIIKILPESHFPQTDDTFYDVACANVSMVVVLFTNVSGM